MSYFKTHFPAAVLLLTLAVMGVLIAGSLTAALGRIDDARYLTAAESLATGHGFARINSPDHPPEMVLPPGYPLLLAPLWWLPVDLSARVILAKLFSLLAGAGSVLLLYHYLVRFRYAGRWGALVVAALTAVNSFQVLYSREVASEALFTAISLLGLIWLERYSLRQTTQACAPEDHQGAVQGRGSPPLNSSLFVRLLTPSYILALIGIASAYYVRSVGVALVIAAAAFLLLARRYRHAAMILGGAGLGISLWLIRGIAAASSGQGYFSQLFRRQIEVPELGTASPTELLLKVLDNLRTYLVDALGSELFPSLSSQNWLNLPASLRLHQPYLPLLAVVSVALVSMLAAGVLVRRRLLYLYVAAYLAVCVLWPWDPSRLLVPLIGLLWFVLLEPIFAAVIVLRRKSRLVLLVAVPVGLYVIWNMAAVGQYAAEVRRVGHDLSDAQLVVWNDSQAAYDWIRSNTPLDAVLAATSDAQVYLYTGRPTSRMDVGLDALLALRVQYLVLVPVPTLRMGLDLSQLQLARLREQGKAAFTTVYESGQATIVRLDALTARGQEESGPSPGSTETVAVAILRFVVVSLIAGLLALVVWAAPSAVQAATTSHLAPLANLLRRSSGKVVALMILTYAAVFSILSILKHQALRTHAFDLGVYDQVLWNTARGDWFELSLVERIVPDAIVSYFGFHFSPTLALLAPFYWLYASPRVLLIAQSALLALGAVPIYWLAREKLGKLWAVLFVAGYLSFPALTYANLFDFHSVALIVPALSFAVYFLLRRRYWVCFPLLLFAMLSKEEVAFVVAAFGVFAILFQRKWGPGLALLTIGLGWVYLATSVVIPIFAPGHRYYYLMHYSYLGGDAGEIVATLLSQPLRLASLLQDPGRLVFVLSLLVPLGFLSVLGIEALLLALPSFGYLLLSSSPLQYSPIFYYGALFVPLLFAAAVQGTARLLTWTRRVRLDERGSPLVSRTIGKPTVPAAVAIFLAASALLSYVWNSDAPLAKGFDLGKYTVDAHAQLGLQLMRAIPAEASVSAQTDLVPHLTHRRRVYLFPDVRESEYVLLDRTAYKYPFTEEDSGPYDAAVRDTLSSGAYLQVFDQDGYLLLHRVAGSRAMASGAPGDE